ncbi:MAG TPA: ABC transporter permease subunit [Gaiellaceae bacterium]|nr:ABC transporter permease subunit [Gaiellaceae bacterium]
MRSAPLVRSRALDELTAFEVGLALRGPGVVLAAAVHGVAMGLVAIVGLGTFRQVGLGAVTPAALGLLEIGLIVPTLVALVLGAAALHGEDEDGVRAALLLSGADLRDIVLAKLLAVVAVGAVVVATGSGVAALLLASSVQAGDLAPFGFIVLVTLLATTASASIGVLISALARDRVQAIVAAIAVWALLAVGIDVVVLLAGSALGAAGPLLVAAAALDPIAAARLAGLIALGADSHVLGSLGTYVSLTLGSGRAMSLLVLVIAAWTVVPVAIAAAAIGRRERS